MFPLNAVLFPGVSVPLKVFEDRYRALVHHLLRVPDPTDRVFGSVGIREGYEVGDHGAQSLFRVGCRVQLTEVESHPDGTFDIVAVGHGPDRARAAGHQRRLPGRARGGQSRAAGSGPGGDRRAGTRDVRGVPRGARHGARRPLPGRPAAGPDVPVLDAGRAVAPLPLHERQALLEAEDASLRLVMVTDLLRDRAARDERDPVAARDRGGAHPLVARTDGDEAWRRRRPAGRRPPWR